MNEKDFRIERRRRLLKCDRCPPHRKENAERVARRSWKSYRKTQYK
jgi:hypothetical protein